MSGQLYSLAALSPRKEPLEFVPEILRALLEKRKISWLCRESNHDSPFCSL
jgi:hypothetical protein